VEVEGRGKYGKGVRKDEKVREKQGRRGKLISAAGTLPTAVGSPDELQA